MIGYYTDDKCSKVINVDVDIAVLDLSPYKNTSTSNLRLNVFSFTSLKRNNLSKLG